MTVHTPGTAPRPPAQTRAPDRPRSWGVRLAVLLPMTVVVLVVVQGLAQLTGDQPVVALLVGLASAAGALAVYRWAVGRLERRPVTEVGRGLTRGLGTGVLVGLAAMGTTITVIAALGGYEVTGWGSLGAGVGAVGAMAAVATTEELLFRGVVFRLAEERLGTWGALAVSAALFGGIHLLNPGATAWGAVALAVEAGALLAAAYVATRSLWLPIGIHLAWNWAEGPLFGTVVSGSTDGAPRSVLTSVVHGSTALTGGAFGPEASVAAVVVCLVPTVVLLRVAAARGDLRHRRAAG